MANIPSFKDMEALMQEFKKCTISKLKQPGREEYSNLDIYTNPEIKNQIARYIDNNALTCLKENGSLPVKKPYTNNITEE